MPLWALRKAGTSKAFQWSVNRQATYIPFAYLQTLLTAYMMKSRERSACKCSNGRIQFSWRSHIRNCRCSGDICSSGEISCWHRDILPTRLTNCLSNWAEKRIDLHTSAVAVQWPMFFYPGGGLKMRKRVICGTAAAATVIGVLLWRWWRK